MNVALFVDTYLPNINGVVTSVVLLKKKLEEHGHNVYVVTTYSGLSKIVEEEDGKIIRLPGLELKQLYGYNLAHPLHLLFISKFKELHIDIIHAQQEFGVGIYASIVSKVLKIPLVRTYHTAYADYTSYFLHIEEGSVVDNAAKFVIEQLSRVVGDDCLRLITPSSKTKEMLKNYGINTPIEVIPTGLELDLFKPENVDKNKVNNIKKSLNIKDDEIVFVYVGRIGSEKSIEMLINGFNLVKKQKDDVRLIIVGDGPNLENLKNLATDLDLKDQIIFTGRKPYEEVPLYYNLADAFVMASITETQGMTYVEALASATALICRKDKVIEDIVIDGKNGYLFEDEKTFAEKCIQYIELTKEQRSKMSLAAYEYALQFDADLFAYNIANMYQEVIEEYSTGLYIMKVNVRKDDNLIVYLDGIREEKIIVSIDTYSELGLRKGSKLTSLEYSKIKKEENYTIAYSKCLSKLSLKDMSFKQIYDYIYSNFDLDKAEIDRLIEKLKSLGLIDDEKFAFSLINSYLNRLYSNKMIKRKLKESGISEEIISKYLLNSPDQELLKAKELCEKYNLLIHGKSINSRKATLYAKLINAGFSNEIATKAITYINYNAYNLIEIDLLKAYAFKAKHKYEKKYSDRELRNKIFNYLMSKGFDSENIYAVMNEMELDDDKTS